MKKTLILFVSLVLIAFSGCSGNNVLDVYLSTKNNNDTEDYISEYTQTIHFLEDLVNFRLSENFEIEYNNGIRPSVPDELKSSIDKSEDLKYRWSCMIAEMTSGLSDAIHNSFGYIYKDINDDGIAELFFVRKDYTILAVFALHNNDVQLLDAYWPRYQGVVSSDNSIFVRSSGGASYTVYQIMKISDDGKLVAIHEFGIDGLSEDGVSLLYYEVTLGEKVSIDETRYNELKTQYPFQVEKSWTDLTINDF